MADRLNAELYVFNVERENIDSLSASKNKQLKSGRRSRINLMQVLY